MIGLGVTELSVTAAAIPAVKAQVRATDCDAARTLAGNALAMSTAAEVRALLETVT